MHIYNIPPSNLSEIDSGAQDKKIGAAREIERQQNLIYNEQNEYKPEPELLTASVRPHHHYLLLNHIVVLPLIYNVLIIKSP